ncbi:CCHC-type domain-containing protein [Trichonephila clavipes]|nr:CCHC-type domain-containing protein [Trichonephila clavipes]
MACEAEDCGFQMLNGDEIVTSVQEESDLVNDETNEDENNHNESIKGPSNADALSALEADMEWCRLKNSVWRKAYYHENGRCWRGVSDEWSHDLKSVQVQKQRACRDESPDPSMSKIVLRNLIISSKYYKEEEAKELLEVITAERNANQSATQNNGQTSGVKSLDEIVKMVRLLTVKVPNKSDGWEYLFSSLENAFASEMVSDELKPKVLLCMLGDKVSNLLVNLGEEELKDYESLKQVVLKEKSYDEPERAKWNDSERRSFNGSWGKQPFGREKSDNFSSRKNFDKGQVTELKKFACFTCGSDKHFKRDCPKNKEVDNKRLNENKVSTEGTELVDGTVAARVDLLGKVIPRQAIEDKLSKLVKISISVDGKLIHALLDSGTEIYCYQERLSSWNIG